MPQINDVSWFFLGLYTILILFCSTILISWTFNLYMNTKLDLNFYKFSFML